MFVRRAWRRVAIGVGALVVAALSRRDVFGGEGGERGERRGRGEREDKRGRQERSRLRVEKQKKEAGALDSHALRVAKAVQLAQRGKDALRWR